MMLSLLFGMLTVAEADVTDWKIRPVIKPIFGVTVFDDGSKRQYASKLGGAAGVSYKQKKTGLKFKGMTRAQYVQVFGSGVTGNELRVGTFIGPWYRVAGVNLGVDYVMDQYQSDYVDIAQASSVNPTLGAVVDLRIVNVSAKIGPSYFVGSGRNSVNWETTDFPGFGDEFFWSANARVGVGPVGLGLGVTKRYTAYGEEFITGVGLSL